MTITTTSPKSCSLAHWRRPFLFSDFVSHKSSLNEHIHEEHEEYLQDYLEGHATYFGGKEQEDTFNAMYVETYLKISVEET